jgi:hypothetical protein
VEGGGGRWENRKVHLFCAFAHLAAVAYVYDARALVTFTIDAGKSLISDKIFPGSIAPINAIGWLSNENVSRNLPLSIISSQLFTRVPCLYVIKTTITIVSV